MTKTGQGQLVPGRVSQEMSLQGGGVASETQAGTSWPQFPNLRGSRLWELKGKREEKEDLGFGLLICPKHEKPVSTRTAPSTWQ